MAETQTAAVDVKGQMDLSMTDSKSALEVRAQNKSPADQAKVKSLFDTIDMGSSTSIISFGVDAQAGLSERSDAILSGVRNKDTGPAGEVMNGLMLQIRGLGLDDLKPGEKQSFFSKLIKKVTPLAKFIQSYENIEGQIDGMVNKLEGEKRKLERDVLMLDGMYDEALVFFNEMAYFIEAGEMKLEDVRENDIPALAKKAQSDEGGMLDAQALRDLTERANDLERKIHDLKLTRQVTMQLLPQLRMIQDVDKSLVTKIQSSVLVTIPMWKTQIAMAITLWRQAEAIKTTKSVTDATNEMLLKNSAMLKDNSASARKEIERGVIDIETIKQVNADLIATIVEATQIAEEGQKARIAASADMLQCEADLKEALKGGKSEATEALEG